VGARLGAELPSGCSDSADDDVALVDLGCELAVRVCDPRGPLTQADQHAQNPNSFVS